MKAILAGLALFLTHSSMVSAQTADASEALKAAIENPNDDEIVEEFIETLIEAPQGSGFFIVEGDIIITRGEVPSYLRNRQLVDDEEAAGSAKVSSELIVNIVAGKYDFLREPEDRNLTYFFDQSTFRSSEEAELTLSSFVNGATSWTNACPECGVSFTRVESAEEASFVIAFLDDIDGPIARAFFPSYPKDMWRIEVFPAYFSDTMSFDRTGVMRHEIGHILGFRHEHINDVPGCSSEGGTYKPITPYTPGSVMHYLCGEGGSFDLGLRSSDIEGFRCLYTKGDQCMFVE
ncbi:hypothetical protein [Ruegeria sp. HKCCA4812]|uniref:hypothetical protein n=1 Tax=Ruegeria sp. HKCCA4812 TaxID=2682993 RepID=UPI001488A6EE|nr:hypothetical protein [Ruegeria sp. HKCCA4812]